MFHVEQTMPAIHIDPQARWCAFDLHEGMCLPLENNASLTVLLAPEAQ
jgi:hypothetical protein